MADAPRQRDASARSGSGAGVGLVGTLRKMRQNLARSVGYNSLAIPIAAGVFEPLGFVLRPEVGAISMSGSSVIVAVNAIALKRLHLPPGR